MKAVDKLKLAKYLRNKCRILMNRDDYPQTKERVDLLMETALALEDEAEKMEAKKNENMFS